MNDDWSRCPICFEDYSLTHRPTTFVCGHSTCIDHTLGDQRLRYCPICRYQFKPSDVFHVSYSLEEAARLFQAIKNKIDWSSVKLPQVLDANDPQAKVSDAIHQDEIYARQLQAELNREIANQGQQTTQAPRPNQPAVNQLVRAVFRPTAGSDHPNSRMKNCGHRCDLVTTTQCCTCSDRRPVRPEHTYERYVDGQGTLTVARRNEYYCSTCKNH